jgi:hypothetical protein
MCLQFGYDIVARLHYSVNVKKERAGREPALLTGVFKRSNRSVHEFSIKQTIRPNSRQRT